MGRKLPILRVAGPTVLVSLLLFAACTLSAVVLYRLHAQTAEGLADDIESRKAAQETEAKLRNLMSLIRSGNNRVDALNYSIDQLITESNALANTDEERELQERLAQSFHRYLHETWPQRLKATGPARADATRAALNILDRETLPTVIALANLNRRQIETGEQELKRTVKWFAWGLVAVGIIGSCGGILLGYGVARALRQSIYQLSVHIRDAADKLGYDLPTVTITQGDGITQLHEQMQGLLREIEQMVQRLQQREREVLRGADGGGGPAGRRRGPRAAQSADGGQAAGRDEPRGSRSARPALGGPDDHRPGGTAAGAQPAIVPRFRPPAAHGAPPARPCRDYRRGAGADHGSGASRTSAPASRRPRRPSGWKRTPASFGSC